MRELFLGAVSCTDEQGRERWYDYSVVIDEMDVGLFCCESYGLKIAEQGSEESSVIPRITTSISRIDELSALVMKGGVTPLTLKDVVEDWL